MSDSWLKNRKLIPDQFVNVKVVFLLQQETLLKTDELWCDNCYFREQEAHPHSVEVDFVIACACVGATVMVFS